MGAQQVLQPLGAGPGGGIIHMSLGRLLPGAENGEMTATPQQMHELCKLVDEYNAMDETEKILMHATWDDLVHLRVDNGILSDWKAEDCEREVLFQPHGDGQPPPTICELSPEDEAKYDLRNE